MDRRVRGRSRVIDVLLIAALAVAGPIPAFAAETHEFDVPAEDAPSAIRDFASQANVQILAAGENVQEKHLHPVAGEYTTEEGLRLLLAGSGLSPKYVGDRSIALIKSSDADSFSQAKAKEGKSSSSSEFRVAQANRGVAQGTPAVESGVLGSAYNSNGGPALTEIVVTAQKREERLQDVPVPVTAISAESLLESDRLQLQDYYTQVPGLTLTPSNQSVQMLTIRGLTTGPGNPTVGITIDGVPYGSSTGLGGGDVVPDIDPNDLARIEVLRGPQGTLYGASSIGGLLNFVTVDPSTVAPSGRVQANSESIHNGSGVGYDFRGSVNVPLSESLALRASAFTREDPGYIDNPFLGERGVNERHTSGGRLSALWKPSEVLSLKVSALYQEIKSEGSNDINVGPGLSGLEQDYIPGVGAYDRTTQAYSAILNAKLGATQLTSITGYNVNSYSDGIDYTSIIGGPGGLTQVGLPALGIPGYGVTGAPVYEHSHTNKVSQELRLTVPLGPAVDWLVGGFYTHERSPYVQTAYAADATTGQIVAPLITFDQPTTLSEAAGFTDLTYRVTDQFDIQVGGRESHLRQTFEETDTGPFVPIFDGFPSPRIYPYGDTSSNAFTYLVTPRFKITPDLMVYARLASGYRAGGPNQAPGGLIPSKYDPDKTQNYELGFKGDFLEHRLSIDTSVYYIEWKDIQLLLADPDNGFNYFANGGKAKSEGVELSANFRPVTSFTLSAWIAWDEAQLTQDLPPTSSVFGLAGDRLPFSPAWSGNLSLQKDYPITSELSAFTAGSVSYVGDRIGAFQPQVAPPAIPPREDYGPYARTDLRAGVKYQSWDVSVFANNVTDRRAILQGGYGYTPSNAFVLIQPRTLGVSVVKTF